MFHKRSFQLSSLAAVSVMTVACGGSDSIPSDDPTTSDVGADAALDGGAPSMVNPSLPEAGGEPDVDAPPHQLDGGDADVVVPPELLDDGNDGGDDAAVCGDVECQDGESCRVDSCQQDCGACELGESCSVDADCEGGKCSNEGVCKEPREPAAPECGDGICDDGESCDDDCRRPDGVACTDASECRSELCFLLSGGSGECRQPIVCGDGVCDPYEKSSCIDDCRPIGEPCTDTSQCFNMLVCINQRCTPTSI